MKFQLFNGFVALAFCLVLAVVWPQVLSFGKPSWTPPLVLDFTKTISVDEFYKGLRDHEIVDADLDGNDVRGHFSDGTAFVFHSPEPPDGNAIQAYLDNNRSQD